MKGGWSIYNQNFNKGEVSHFLHYRTDLKSYPNSCKKLQNFCITPQGAVRRRGGSRFCADLDPYTDFSKSIKLVPFEFESDVGRVLVFYHSTWTNSPFCRIYTEKEDGTFQFGDKDWINLSSVLPTDVDFTKLQYIQSYDVLFFAHPNAKPFRIERHSTGWKLNTNVFLVPPMKTEHANVKEIDFYNVENTTFFDDNVAKCTATMIVETINYVGFENLGVGDVFSYEYDISGAIFGTFTDNATSKYLPASESITFTTKGGIWEGNAILEFSEDNGRTWYRSGSISSVNGSSNEYLERDIEHPFTIARARMENYKKPTNGTGCKYVLDAGATATAYAKILNIRCDRTSVEMNVEFLNPVQVSQLEKGGKITLPCFDKQNNPSAIGIYEERLVFGGTQQQPHTLWFSETNNWNRFITGTLATSSIEATLACKSFEKIKSLYPSRSLLILTDRGEHSFDSRTETEGLSGTNIKVKPESYYGSGEALPVCLNDTLMFVRCDNKRITDINYEYSKDGYVSSDMTLMSEHLFESGVKEITALAIPYGNLFCLCNDGTLAVLMYLEKEEILGWSRFVFGDEVVAMTGVRSNYEDTLVMVVKVGEKYHLESWKQHYDFFQDGYTGGTATEEHNRNYTSICEPLPVIIKEGAYGMPVIIKGVSLCLYDSIGGEVSVDNEKYHSISKYAQGKAKREAISGEIEITTNSGFRDKVEVSVRSSEPHPLNLSAIGFYGKK